MVKKKSAKMKNFRKVGSTRFNFDVNVLMAMTKAELCDKYMDSYSKAESGRIDNFDTLIELRDEAVRLEHENGISNSMLDTLKAKVEDLKEDLRKAHEQADSAEKILNTRITAYRDAIGVVVRNIVE